MLKDRRALRNFSPVCLFKRDDNVCEHYSFTTGYFLFSIFFLLPFLPFLCFFFVSHVWYRVASALFGGGDCFIFNRPTVV
jgi:hypothetical protein